MTDASRTHSFAFAVAAIGLAVVWLGAGLQLDSRLAVMGVAAIVLLLGLPHGALDLWVARRSGLWGREGGFVTFHLVYLSLAALVAGAFAAAPVASLVAFLALSLWHFADDWRGLPPPVKGGCALVIVLVPTLFHPQEVARIFQAITMVEAGGGQGVPYLAWLVSAWIVTGAVGAAFLIDRRAAAEVVCLIGLGVVLPPLVFFAAYFTLLHGPRHLLRHRALLRTEGAGIVLVAYTAAALVIVVGLTSLFGEGGPPQLTAEIYRTLFIGLAALTVPHSILIEYHKRLDLREDSRSSSIADAAARL